MAESERILCVTMSDWDGPKYGRHHLMNIIANKHKVVWVEEPVSFGKFSVRKISRFLKFLKPPRKIKENLIILTPPPSLPFIDILPLFNMINGFVLCLWLKSKLRGLGFSPTIFWAFFCFTPYLVGKFGENLSIYFCNDPYFDNQFMIANERELCQKVDLIFTVSNHLTDTKKEYNNNCHTILHGVDVDSFCSNNIPVPEDVKHIKKPIIGYVGAIKGYMDFDLLKYLANEHPEWSILLVGHMLKMRAAEWEKWQSLEQQQNIYILGKKEGKQIPGYIKLLDVALFPYNVEKCKDYKKGLYWQVPLKFFEYLVMGKPIVSTDYTGYEGIPANYYEMAHTNQEFLHKIEKSLLEDSEAKKSQRIACARKNSWQHRVEQMAGYISATRTRKLKQQNTV